MSDLFPLFRGKIRGTAQVLATPTPPLTHRPALSGGRLMSQSTIIDPGVFWSKVAIADQNDCWLWQQSVGSHGYGQTWDGEHVLLAHRVAWELTHGPIPEGLFVCHRCDVRRCVNARAHLFLGTAADNRMDAARKGRAWAKLDVEKVREMRRRYVAGGVSTRQLAREYDVDRRAIVFALRGQTWSHVDDGGGE